MKVEIIESFNFHGGCLESFNIEHAAERPHPPFLNRRVSVWIPMSFTECGGGGGSN